MKFKLRVIILTMMLISGFLFAANADTVYLKNGHSLEGFVINEDDSGIDLEVGFGTIRVEKNLILQITKSGLQESQLLRQKWDETKREVAEWEIKEKAEDDARKKEEVTPVKEKRPLPSPQEIEVFRQGRHFFVEAILNKKISVSLMLDTGASLVVLSKEIGEELGVDTYIEDPEDKAGMVTMILADGTKTQAKFIRLESIAVEGAVAENVAAAVLLEDQVDPGFKDGLLGMSFLSKFNFKVDRANDRIILEPLE